MRERALISLFRSGDVERNRGTATTALDGEPAIALIEQEVLTGGKEESTEAAAVAIGPGNLFLLDETGKERLCQILRFFD